MSAPKLDPLERLTAGGIAAPSLRAKRRYRKITTIDKDGNPVRVVTDEALAISMLKRVEIEFDVTDGMRPHAVCKVCSATFRPRTSRHVKCQTCTKKTGTCGSCDSTIATKRTGKRATGLCMRCIRLVANTKRTCACGAPKIATALRCKRCHDKEWSAAPRCPDCSGTGPYGGGRCSECINRRRSQRAKDCVCPRCGDAKGASTSHCQVCRWAIAAQATAAARADDQRIVSGLWGSGRFQSKKALAMAIGVPQSVLSCVLSGDRTIPEHARPLLHSLQEAS